MSQLDSVLPDPDPEGQPDFTVINGQVYPRQARQVNKPAGVLILVRPIDGEPHVVFMRRTDKVLTHKGEVSFPGGGYKEGVDADLEAAALREAQEELGLNPAHLHVLGALPPRETVASSYIVHPFVAVPIDPAAPITYVADTFEVADILELPLRELARHESLVNDIWTLRGHQVRVYYYLVNGVTVWGATARILHDMLTAMAQGEYAEAAGSVVVPPPISTPRVVLRDSGL